MNAESTPEPGTAEIRVGRLEDLPDHAGVALHLNGRRIALFRSGDSVFALDGTCPHAGGPLADGLVRDGIVTCPWHWWRFRLESGERLGAPGIRVRRYDVSVRNGEVYVRVPPPEPQRPLRERLLAAGRAWEARRHATVNSSGTETGGSPPARIP